MRIWPICATAETITGLRHSRIIRVTDMSDFKKKIQDIIAQRQLTSCMNDTKWNELRTAMTEEMPFPPPYSVKFLDCAAPVPPDTHHTGDWHYVYAIDGEAFNGAYAVEWIKIVPKLIKPKGRLIPPDITDASAELIDILKKHSIPYEEKDGEYIIYGYKA